MRKVTVSASGSIEVVDNRKADNEAARLIAASKRKCAKDILAVAPDYKQRNAALGLYDETETAGVVAHITACRSAQNAAEAAIQSILDNAELDNAGKLAAFDAL